MMNLHGSLPLLPSRPPADLPRRLVPTLDGDETSDGEKGGDQEGPPFLGPEAGSPSSSSMTWSARACAVWNRAHLWYPSASHAEAVLIRSLGMSFFCGDAWQKTMVTSVK